jgi:hypothetical protein
VVGDGARMRGPAATSARPGASRPNGTTPDLASPRPNGTIPTLLASPGAASKTPKATSRSLCRADTDTGPNVNLYWTLTTAVTPGPEILFHSSSVSAAPITRVRPRSSLSLSHVSRSAGRSLFSQPQLSLAVRCGGSDGHLHPRH